MDKIRKDRTLGDDLSKRLVGFAPSLARAGALTTEEPPLTEAGGDGYQVALSDTGQSTDDESMVGRPRWMMPHQALLGVSVSILAAVFIYAFLRKPETQPLPTPRQVPAVGREVSLTSTPTWPPTPTPTPTSPVAHATAFSTPPIPTPPPGGLVLTLTPAAGTVGSASNLDGKARFGDRNIHVGTFKGHIYHGALQFDLSVVPADSIIVYAALELVGLGDQNVGQTGTWELRVLDPAIDTAWSALTYDLLHNAIVEETIPPALRPADLARDRLNVFVFGPDQLIALQRHLVNGLISFRLDGPTLGHDNLFTWDGGPDSEESGERKPVLRIVALPPTPTPTPTFVFITSTPTPENILTVAAIASTATFQAANKNE